MRNERRTLPRYTAHYPIRVHLDDNPTASANVACRLCDISSHGLSMVCMPEDFVVGEKLRISIVAPPGIAASTPLSVQATIVWIRQFPDSSGALQIGLQFSDRIDTAQIEFDEANAGSSACGVAP